MKRIQTRRRCRTASKWDLKRTVKEYVAADCPLKDVEKSKHSEATLRQVIESTGLPGAIGSLQQEVNVLRRESLDISNRSHNFALQQSKTSSGKASDVPRFPPLKTRSFENLKKNLGMVGRECSHAKDPRRSYSDSDRSPATWGSLEEVEEIVHCEIGALPNTAAPALPGGTFQFAEASTFLGRAGEMDISSSLGPIRESRERERDGLFCYELERDKLNTGDNGWASGSLPV